MTQIHIPAARRRSFAFAALAALSLALTTTTAAFAVWSTHSSAGSSARAHAQTMTAGHAPTATASLSDVNLSWAASPLSSGAAVGGYIVKRYNTFDTLSTIGGTCTGIVATTSCTDTTVTNGTWKYSVTPVLSNWRGAESAKTTVVVNAAPPSATITNPAASAIKNAVGWDAACASSICGTTSSATGVSSVAVSVRQQSSGNYWTGSSFLSASEVLLPAAGTTTWNLPFAATNFPTDGAYTVRVVATDIASNSGTASRAFTFDNTNPSIGLGAPALVKNGASFSAAASDAFGVASVAYTYCLGSGCTPTTPIGSSSSGPNYLVSWTSQPADGSYTVGATATDNGGNAATSTANVVVDNTAPVTTDDTATITNTWRNTSAVVTLSRTEANGIPTTYYTTNGSTPTTSSAQGTSVSLTADGIYTIKYFSVDSVGNTEAVKTAGTQIRIDKTAPTAATLGTVPANIRNGQILTATGTDALSGVGSVSYFYCAGTSCNPTVLIGTSSTPTGNFPVTWSSQPADGNYSVMATVFDQAGNSLTSSKQTTKIDNTAPTATITFPVASTTYNTTTWATITGTANDGSGSGVGSVALTVQKSGGNYWNGTSFSSATAVNLAATGTTSWTYSIAAANFTAGTYIVTATSTDLLGAASTVTSKTFSMDIPTAFDIQGNPSTANGRPGTNDTIVYTFSELMSSTSIKSGWNGTSTSVTAHFDDDGFNGTSSLTITGANLGLVDLGDTGTLKYVKNNGQRYDLAATMVMTSVGGRSVVTITLTANAPTANDTVTGTTTLQWLPGSGPTDPSGNPISTTIVAVQSTGPKQNF